MFIDDFISRIHTSRKLKCEVGAELFNLFTLLPRNWRDDFCNNPHFPIHSSPVAWVGANIWICGGLERGDNQRFLPDIRVGEVSKL